MPTCSLDQGHFLRFTVCCNRAVLRSLIIICNALVVSTGRTDFGGLNRLMMLLLLPEMTKTLGGSNEQMEQHSFSGYKLTTLFEHNQH